MLHIPLSNLTTPGSSGNISPVKNTCLKQQLLFMDMFTNLIPYVLYLNVITTKTYYHAFLNVCYFSKTFMFIYNEFICKVLSPIYEI